MGFRDTKAWKFILIPILFIFIFYSFFIIAVSSNKYVAAGSCLGYFGTIFGILTLIIYLIDKIIVRILLTKLIMMIKK